MSKEQKQEQAQQQVQAPQVEQASPSMTVVAPKKRFIDRMKEHPIITALTAGGLATLVYALLGGRKRNDDTDSSSSMDEEFKEVFSLSNDED